MEDGGGGREGGNGYREVSLIGTCSITCKYINGLG